MIERKTILTVENLYKQFQVRLGAFGENKGTVHAVDGVDFDILRGETLGLVGESGCGKSTVGYTILQLYRATSGKIWYDGKDLTQLSDKQLRPLRQKIQMIFQDPYSTLNPRMTIGEALAEPILEHQTVPEKEVIPRVVELLGDAGLSSKCMDRYPHEFSGGQRQRICIVRALACNPEFIVCDEPISALDVSVQAQIINLLQDLQEKYNLTYLFIAHDLSVVKHISNRVAVMYLGKMAELGPKDLIFNNPMHPYTKALLQAIPIPNPHIEKSRTRELLTGDIPSALNPPAGCHFHTRCSHATDLCSQETPRWKQLPDGRMIACHLAVE